MAFLLGDGLDDGAPPDQRIAFEIHLGDQPLGEAVAKNRKMDMRGAPIVDAIWPGIRTGLDRAEAIESIFIGYNAAASAEIRISGAR